MTDVSGSQSLFTVVIRWHRGQVLTLTARVEDLPARTDVLARRAASLLLGTDSEDYRWTLADAAGRVRDYRDTAPDGGEWSLVEVGDDV